MWCAVPQFTCTQTTGPASLVLSAVLSRRNYQLLSWCLHVFLRWSTFCTQQWFSYVLFSLKSVRGSVLSSQTKNGVDVMRCVLYCLIFQTCATRFASVYELTKEAGFTIRNYFCTLNIQRNISRFKNWPLCHVVSIWKLLKSESKLNNVVCIFPE